MTAPTNRGSIAFHTRMGFSPLPGPCSECDVPFLRPMMDQRGPGPVPETIARSDGEVTVN